MSDLRRDDGSIVRHTHGWYRYVAHTEDEKCEGCRDPPVPSLNTGMEIRKWQSRKRGRNRGDVKHVNCGQCYQYNHIQSRIAKTKFLMKDDGRLVNHMQRHGRYEGSEAMEGRKLQIPTEFCGLCDDANRLYKSLDFWGIQMRQLGEGIERHVLLHKGFDEHDMGWYQSDWENWERMKREGLSKKQDNRVIFKYKRSIIKLCQKIRKRFPTRKS